MSAVPQKWLNLLSLLPGYDPLAQAGNCTFDARVAEAAIRFVEEQLVHIEGEHAGNAFKLEDWQKALIGCAFGWKQPDGRRRYREVMLYVPRKNGKSCLLAALLNLVAFCDREPGAQVYSAAADREQAALVYRQAKGMIERNERLAESAKVYSSFKSIEFPDNVIYKALSADAETKHGFNSHFIVVDELHAQPNRELVDVLLTSTGSRRQPMVWYITTADFDRESICNEKYDYACKVRDNGGDPAKPGYDPSFLPVIYELTKDEAFAEHETPDGTKLGWELPENWRKANPNLGVSVHEEYLQREAHRAKETPSYLNTFLRLHLNIRTTNDVAWLKMEQWDACGREVPDMTGRECYAGMDLASTTDVAAFVLVFPPKVQGEPVYVMPHFWIPEENARKRELRDKVPYVVWERIGLIRMTEGDSIDYDVIRRDIGELATRYKILNIGADRWNATQLINQLMQDGLSVVIVEQGFRGLNPGTKELERLVIAKQMAHGRHAVLRWMAGNTMVETDAMGNIKPSKKKSTEKIDGIVALVMALGLSMSAEAPKPSVYEFRGILELGNTHQPEPATAGKPTHARYLPEYDFEDD